MRKLLSGFTISSVVILAFVILDVNQRCSASANTQDGTPLTLSQLEKLINVPTPDPTVALIIQRRGIAFAPTEKILARLKSLGAGTETIKALRKYLRSAPTPPPRPRPSPVTTPPKPSSNPNTVTILVANFRGPDPQNYLVTDKIIQGLRAATSAYPDISIQPLEETITEQTGNKGGSEYARDIGTKRNASIVLWGYYGATSEQVDINVYFEVLRKPKGLSLRQNLETETLPIADLKGFKIQARLSKEMSYLVLLTLGLAHYESGNYDVAIDRYTKAIAQSEAPDQIIDPADIYFYRGIAYYRKAGASNIDHAIADYTEAIKLKPNLVEAYNNRGVAYYQKNKLDRAIADYTEVIKLKPNLAEPYYNRGLVYSNKGEFDRAIADYNEAIKRKPDLADAYYNLGVLYTKKGEFDRAIANYSEAIKLKPGEADAYYGRGNAYYKKGELDRAIADYNEAIKRKPDLVEAYYNRGRAYYMKDELDRAIADFTETIKRKPDDSDAYYNRGNAYYKKNEFDRAIADFTETIKRKPNDPNAYHGRVIAYMEKGEIERAIADLKSLLRTTNDPNIRQIAEQMLHELGVK